MSSEWRLEELGTIVTGKTPSKAIENAFLSSGIPFLTPKDMDGQKWISSTERYLSDEGVRSVRNSVVPPRSVAVSCIGSDMGKAVLIAAHTVTNQQINTIVPDEKKCNADYLYYLLSTMQQNLKDIAGGSATPILNKGHFGKVQIELPGLSYQIRAAKILSALDDKIQINHQINQTLEQMAQAIFKSWFVDFDPVKAKIAALEAGGNEKDALLASMQAISGKEAAALTRLQNEQPDQYNELRSTARLFPSAMQDSELGEIPAGWESIKLGDCLDVLETGARPKGGVSGIHEGVPSVGAENIIGVGNYNYGKEKFVSVDFFGKLKRGIVENLDCLLYKDGGKPGDFRPRVSMFGCGFPYEKFAINEHVFRLRSKRLGQAFLYFQVAHERVLADLRHKGAKAAIPGINQTDVKSIWFICPSATILNVFNKNIESLLISILIRSRESLHLSDLRDTVLPKLLSGELSITDAESQLAEVANN